ncbi:hypothetical protein PV08_03526 [Exophiala spinifera]|uniref:Uncharacterized protein n=1 Tax=Exophiala spinifera TaxID=91928 RepID=A0A0D2A2R1_9EURO|nr:uncharacterized protein PV08_03526 [Exophiala spinifera]KIW19232.1 hypothetical protein PV08_03526 [Exophiala spinifera]
MAKEAAIAGHDTAAAPLSTLENHVDSVHDIEQDFGQPTHEDRLSTTTPPGQDSEHGHSLARIRPITRHRGSSVSTFFNGLFSTAIAITTLGASITFSYVLSNGTAPPTSKSPAFSQYQVQQFLAISWLLFLLALAFASLGSTLLTFFKNHWIADWDGANGETSQVTVQLYAVVASGLLGGLIIGAFALLCLVVMAFSAGVGWAALSFTAFFGLVILFAVMHQIPWSWRRETPSTPTKHRSA